MLAQSRQRAISRIKILWNWLGVEQDKGIVQYLLRGVIFIFLLQASGVAILFCVNVLLGKQLGAEGYGTFNFTVVGTNLLAVFVLLGWPTSLLRFVSQYIEHQEWALLRGIILKSHQIVILSSIVAGVILILASNVVTSYFDANISKSLVFSGLMLPFVCLAQIRNHILRGLKHVSISVFFESTVIPLLFLLVILIYAPTSPTNALLWYLGINAIVLVFGSLTLLKLIPLECKNLVSKFEFSQWIWVAIPLLLGSISQIIMNRTDTIMLGFMVDMSVVGIYSAASRIAMLNIFVLAAINTIAAPMLASAFHGERRQQFSLILRSSMAGSALATLPVLLVVLAAPEYLLGLFGDEFSSGRTLLRILALGQFVNAITGPVAYALMVSKQEVIFAHITGWTSLANVLGNFFAISMWGAMGAAIVTALATVVSNGLMFWVVWYSSNNLSLWLRSGVSS